MKSNFKINALSGGKEEKAQATANSHAVWHPLTIIRLPCHSNK